MTLSIGFDPGGTGRKWSYVCAGADADDQLFIGCLKDGNRQPYLYGTQFPYLSSGIEHSIKNCLDRFLKDVNSHFTSREVNNDPLKEALNIFGNIIVAIDAPCGFAAPSHGVRNTEQHVGGNFVTPDEGTFVAKALDWQAQGNLTPLRQKVYWKLVGFCIYRYFFEDGTISEISKNCVNGITDDFRVPSSNLVTPGVRVLESFPSEIYRTTSDQAFQLARELAGRKLVQLPGAPLSTHTFNRFALILRDISQGNRSAWRRYRIKAGDALDAFSGVFVAEAGRQMGLVLRGNDLNRLKIEGAIAVPP